MLLHVTPSPQRPFTKIFIHLFSVLNRSSKESSSHIHLCHCKAIEGMGLSWETQTHHRNFDNSDTKGGHIISYSFKIEVAFCELFFQWAELLLWGDSFLGVWFLFQGSSNNVVGGGVGQSLVTCCGKHCSYDFTERWWLVEVSGCLVTWTTWEHKFPLEAFHITVCTI